MKLDSFERDDYLRIADIVSNVRFSLVLLHINHCILFNINSSLYLYIKYIFLAWFNGISTIVGYLKPNTFYTYILNIYDLVGLGFMTYQPLYVI